ncbi:MAG: hypothetical protein QM711_03885 [Micropruina sp.]|uniref:hypothetical protein n=1 Tax=Micropruina sp. TaxID=2737536 RepID=UPI0039E52B90
MAQITGVVFSTCLWLVVGALWPVTAAVLAMGCGALVAGRWTAAGLWWRFGARPARDWERDRLLAALVPIVALRGRRQPTIWIGRYASASTVVMAGGNLIVGERVLGHLMCGDLDEQQACALACHALGRQDVYSSAIIAAVDAYCTPWNLLALIVREIRPRLRRVPLLSFAWRIRWLTFGVALVDSAHHGRWLAFVGVALIATSTWSTGYLQTQWYATRLRLGDRRVVAEGYGPALAGLLQRAPTAASDVQRIHTLTTIGTSS